MVHILHHQWVASQNHEMNSLYFHQKMCKHEKKCQETQSLCFIPHMTGRFKKERERERDVCNGDHVHVKKKN